MTANPKNQARQSRLIAGLLEGKTLPEAARDLGIAEPTAFRLARDPAFKADLAEARRAVIGDAINVLSGAARSAAESIAAIVNDDSAPPALRLKAATAVLDRLGAWIELDDLAQRVDALETTILVTYADGK